MKIRTGFVSNSSSSSFVIGKYFMTKEQIREFQSIVNSIEENDYSETCVYEDDHYFYGSLDNHDDNIDMFIEREGLSDYFGNDC